METLSLKRSLLDNCALGKMSYQNVFICHTVEKPYVSNIPFKSCIPPGVYRIFRHHTEKRPNSFVLINHNLGIGLNKGNVQRYACCIHIANYPDQVQGCIGPGLEQNLQTYGVTQSRKAMDVLNKLINLEAEDWQLEIIQ